MRRPIDPIEANALHGGRMSMRDSIVVALQTMASNGFGASVGLEAGYTQLVAGIASRLGIGFRLRRGDLRMLVGCGAASAIAAAFGAPLTGAFYGFELIIGTYTAAALAPVLTASIAGVLVSHMFGSGAVFDHGRSLVDVPQLGPSHRACARAGLRRHRHPDDARRDHDGDAVPSVPDSDDRPPDPRRPDRRRPRADQPASALVRPRGAQAHAQFGAAGDRPDLPPASFSRPPPPPCRWARASAAACSSPRCSWARSPASSSPP